ncbi:LON peptidase substrate-binding domain-containing protein, partial [Porticoccaceae bacterium]|nr:LON peptidase substrate-binding domain-containing protein [Porticoccaceae bacterium]
MGSKKTDADKIIYPLLPLRDVVVYPHMVVPLFVGREKSIVALEAAMELDKQIILVAQRNPSEDNPGIEDVYEVGTFATILQMLKLPDGTLKVLVEGTGRVSLVEPHEGEAYMQTCIVELVEEALEDTEADAVTRSTLSLFEQYVNLSKKIPSEVITTVSGIEAANRLADTIASHMTLSLEQKQEVLEVADLTERFEHLMGLMEAEIDLFQIEQRIRGRVKKQMEKSQREYYLNEQMKAIQKELGDIDEGVSELDHLDKKIQEAGMPKDALEKAQSELAKLKMMSPMSAEASVLRNYIDCMIGVPW